MISEQMSLEQKLKINPYYIDGLPPNVIRWIDVSKGFPNSAGIKFSLSYPDLLQLEKLDCWWEVIAYLSEQKIQNNLYERR